MYTARCTERVGPRLESGLAAGPLRLRAEYGLSLRVTRPRAPERMQNGASWASDLSNWTSTSKLFTIALRSSWRCPGQLRNAELSLQHRLLAPYRRNNILPHLSSCGSQWMFWYSE